MKTLAFLFIFSFVFGAFAQKTAVVLPERFKDAPVIVVNDDKYKEIIKNNKELALQLDQEKKNLELFTKSVDEQKRVNQEIQNKLIVDYNNAQITIQKLEKQKVQKDLAILWRNIVIATILLMIGVYLYLKFYLRLPI
jgi:preprotein translocase subunit SecF